MSETLELNPPVAVETTETVAYALPSTPKPAASLKMRALRGSLWTILGYGGSQVLRLAGNVILTRLLFPEAFGQMVLVNVFLQGLHMFSDVGIGPSLIQSKRGDDPDFLN